MLDCLIALLDDLNDFSRQAAKAIAMLCYYAEWRQARLLVGHKQIRLIILGGLMLNDMSFPPRPLLDHNNFEKNQVSQKSSQCLEYIILTILAIFLRIMRQKGCFIAIIVAHALHRMAKLMPTVPWTANKNGQKTNNPRHDQ